MNSNESQELSNDFPLVPDTEPGAWAAPATGEAVGDHGGAEIAATDALIETGSDLLSEEDLKAIMIQFNPHAFKDITTIQKGVENFFLFAQSHLALTHPEQLQHLGEKDLRHLEERGALVLYEYIKLSEDRSRLSTKTVVIRPASLKGEQIAKGKLGCVRGSVVSILE